MDEDDPGTSALVKGFGQGGSSGGPRSNSKQTFSFTESSLEIRSDGFAELRSDASMGGRSPYRPQRVNHFNI